MRFIDIMPPMKQYTVKRTKVTPAIDGAWDGPAWSEVPSLNVDHFHQESSDHRPVTKAKMVYDDLGFYVIFHVEDQYVRCVHTQRQGDTYLDSCVEIYVEPVPGRGYFNFEINCGGALYLHYNTRPPSVIDDSVAISDARLDQVKIYHSMPKTVEPQITEPTTWHIEFFCPYEILESYVGQIKPCPGRLWRGNFFKCADECSKPHWAMWNPIPCELDFGKPEHFAPLIFKI